MAARHTAGYHGVGGVPNHRCHSCHSWQAALQYASLCSAPTLAVEASDAQQRRWKVQSRQAVLAMTPDQWLCGFVCGMSARCLLLTTEQYVAAACTYSVTSVLSSVELCVSLTQVDLQQMGALRPIHCVVPQWLSTTRLG